MITIDLKTTKASVAEPANAAGGGVLVCMHGPGVEDFILDICERLAGLGYVAIAPHLYDLVSSDEAMPFRHLKDTEVLEVLQQAINYLDSREDVQSIGAIGFCMGGRLAFLNACHEQRLKCTVIFHGGDIMKTRHEDMQVPPLDQAEGITSPILGIFGADDVNPSLEDMATIGAELDRLGKPHTFESYEGCGHAFLNFTRASDFRQAQAEKAWLSCSSYLQQHLI